MPGNIHCITDETLQLKDDFIILDTNVILDLIGYNNSTDPRIQEIKDFISKLSINNVIAVIPVKVWEELNLIIEKDIIGNKHKNPHYDLNVLTTQVYDKVENIKNSLSVIPNVYVDAIGEINATTLQKATENRSKYGLKWGDANILAIAQQNEISNILTCDKDYLKVTDNKINIFVDSNTYSRNLTNNNALNLNSSNPLVSIR